MGSGFGRARLAVALGLSFAASAALPGSARATVSASFQSPNFSVATGDTFTATIVVTPAGAEFNAFDASVRFDPAMLSFEAIAPVADQRGALMTGACLNTFHQFSAASDSLRITLSLLCNNTFVTGPGTVYRVRFRAGSTQGTTSLTLGPFTEFYRAGLFVRPLNRQSMTVTIGAPTAVEPGRSTGSGIQFAPPAPNPRRGTGAVQLDFVLPAADLVSFDVLDLQGRRIAGRDAQRFEAGPHRVSWSPRALPSGEYLLRLRGHSSGSVVRRWSLLR